MAHNVRNYGIIATHQYPTLKHCSSSRNQTTVIDTTFLSNSSSSLHQDLKKIK